ncbi:hypothetical protein [Dryocola sp. BD613]|uniref:hypothetical protein n=1 Tax=Dryocola sp. BD613 TaxID=3133272 RepID=UPI003F506442
MKSLMPTVAYLRNNYFKAMNEVAVFFFYGKGKHEDPLCKINQERIIVKINKRLNARRLNSSVGKDELSPGDFLAA